MISVNTFWIITIIIYAVAFLVEIFLGFISIHLGKTKYSPFRNFPCELVCDFSKGYLFKIGNIICSVSSLLLIAIVIVYKDEFGELYVLTLLIGAFICLVHLFSISLINISVFYVKEHSIISSIYMALSFFISIMTSFYCYYLSYLYKMQSTGSNYHLSLGIISTIFSLISLIILFNPKLKNWAKLDKDTRGQEAIYSRPKYFPLAYSEWGMILISFISGLIFILSLISV